MEEQNIALGAKLIWKLYYEPGKLWCKIMQKKYMDCEDPTRILTLIVA